MSTLIQRQEACIARMLEPRTSERRARKNRGAALRQFRQQCAAAGYAPEDIALLEIDTVDTYRLRRDAEDAAHHIGRHR